MTLAKTLRSSVLAASALVLASSGSALALDGDAFAKRFVDQFSSQGGGDLTYSGVSTDGDMVTLNDLSLTTPEFSFSVGDVVFEGVSEASDGTYLADRATIPDISAGEDGLDVTVSGISMEGIELPAPDAPAGFMFYDRATVGLVGVALDGRDFMTMRDFVTIMEGNDDRTEMDFDSQIASFLMDFRAVQPDGKAMATLEALDAVTIAGSMSMAGGWKASDGSLDVETMKFDIPGQGSLDTSVAILGYTLDFMNALQDATEAMRHERNPQAQQGAQMAMLGLLQQLSYGGLSLRYEDDGFAGRMLDYQAAQQGMDRQTMINQTKGVLPFLLAQLNKPDFVAQTVQAVGAFLDNPQSLTITAIPEAPVPAAILTATGMTAPQNLIDQLNVKITAND